MFKLNENESLTPLMLQKFIEKHKWQEQHKQKLLDYYLGNHGINKRHKSRPTAPCNNIVNPFANYIVNLNVGYFIGEPVTYKSDDTQLEYQIKQILNYNDEQSNNVELVKEASTIGVAYELCYIDTDGAIRFRKIDGVHAFPIYDTTIEEELLYFVRYYAEENIMTNHNTLYVEVYSRNDVKTYKQDIGEMALVNTVPHSFGIVPISIYQNNNEEMGDFETVISLIDSYDTLISDAVDDEEQFTDAYLVITNALSTTAEDINAACEDKVMLLDADSKAEWLVKNNSGSAKELLKNTIAENIHKFSFTPAMTDENFAANASGVAMRFKLLGLESATAKKESAFKKGLQRRLELICNILSIMGQDFDYRDIEITFTRNLPVNVAETADTINKLSALLSKETLASMLPIEIDWDSEKKRLEEESQLGYDNYELLEESSIRE